MSGFDLDAYLERIFLAVAPDVSAEGLAALQLAHRLAIPFENLDIILGRGIAIDSDSVFAKLVTARRGGYCFEQNRLFGDALAALGFSARPLLARVWLGGVETPPQTHTFSLVTVDGQDWIADPGFGGSYTPPMPLIDGVRVPAPDGGVFRLNMDPVQGWMLSRDGVLVRETRGDGNAQHQYSFTLAPAYDSDLVLGNHWTSTAPISRFRNFRLVSIVLPRGFASLTDRAYRGRAAAHETMAEITDPRVYRLRLSMMFGIDLSVEEVAALGLFEHA